MAPAPPRNARAAVTLALASDSAQSLTYPITGSPSGDSTRQASTRPQDFKTTLGNVVSLSAFGVVANAPVGEVAHL